MRVVISVIFASPWAPWCRASTAPPEPIPEAATGRSSGACDPRSFFSADCYKIEAVLAIPCRRSRGVFLDGNGRMSRAAMRSYMKDAGLRSRPHHPISSRGTDADGSTIGTRFADRS